MSLQVPILTFRDSLRRVCPPWLQRGFAAKIIEAIGIHLDIVGDATVAAVKQRYPLAYSAESLPFIGHDRKIRRGIGESDQTYAARLLRWLDDHARRGGPYAMLQQLYAHYVSDPSAPFPISLVSYLGNRYTLAADGSITHDQITWTPDLDSTHWARWWLFYSWPDPVVTDGVWSDPGTWDDGGVWDSSLTPAEVSDLRAIPTEWNAAHAQGTITLVAPDVELWDFPPGVWSDPGTWGDYPGGISQIRVA